MSQKMLSQKKEVDKSYAISLPALPDRAGQLDMYCLNLPSLIKKRYERFYLNFLSSLCLKTLTVLLIGLFFATPFAPVVVSADEHSTEDQTNETPSETVKEKSEEEDSQDSSGEEKNEKEENTEEKKDSYTEDSGNLEDQDEGGLDEVVESDKKEESVDSDNSSEDGDSQETEAVDLNKEDSQEENTQVKEEGSEEGVSEEGDEKDIVTEGGQDTDSLKEEGGQQEEESDPVDESSEASEQDGSDAVEEEGLDNEESEDISGEVDQEVEDEDLEEEVVETDNPGGSGDEGSGFEEGSDQQSLEEIIKKLEEQIRQELKEEMSHSDQGIDLENFKKDNCTFLSENELYCLNDSEKRDRSERYVGITAYADQRGVSQIVYQEGSNRVRQLTDNDFEDRNPAYNSDRSLATWERLVNDRWQVVVYDLREDREVYITEVNFNNINPTLSAHGVVWQGWKDGGWEIFYTSLQQDGLWKERQLSNDSFQNVEPQIFGDTVIWRSYRSGEWHIASFNLQSGKEVSLGVGKDASNPRLLLIWNEGSEDGNSLMQFDPLSNRVSKLSQSGSESDDKPDPVPNPFEESEATLSVNRGLGEEDGELEDDEDGEESEEEEEVGGEESENGESSESTEGEEGGELDVEEKNKEL